MSRCDEWQTLPMLHWHCCVLSQEECIWFRGGYKWFLTAFPCQPKHLLRLYMGCSEARCKGHGQASFTKVASCNYLNMQNLAGTVEACPGNAEEFQSPLSNWLLHSSQVTNFSTSWRCVTDCHIYCPCLPIISLCLFWMENATLCQQFSALMEIL